MRRGFLIALGLAACASEPLETPEPEARFGKRNEAQWARMRSADPDGPFHMLNLIKFRAKASYLDGRSTSLTGREANDLYQPLPHLMRIGAAPVFVGEVSEMLLGDGTRWDQVAIVRYPSRELLLEMIEDPDFVASSVHKEAGVEETIVMVSHLMSVMTASTSTATPFPPSPGNPPVDVVHVMKFRDQADYGPDSTEPARTGKEAVDLYSTNAGQPASRLGVSPKAWFEVEEVLIGDDRSWDELRINHMPQLHMIAPFTKIEVQRIDRLLSTQLLFGQKIIARWCWGQ